MSERWADVLGYGGLYQVSDQGRVRQGRGVYSRVLSQTKTNVGYLVVSLSDGTGFKRKYVHRLVAEAFMPDHAKGAEVNHINGDKTDNRLVNLEWVTHRENMQHARNVLKRWQGRRNLYARKLTDDDVMAIRSSNETQQALADRYGVSQVAIHNVKVGKTYKEVE